MTDFANSPLIAMLSKFERWASFSDDDRNALLALPFHTCSVERGRYVLRDRDPTTNTHLVLSGFAFREKIVSNGARQILSIHMAGDIIDLTHCLLGGEGHDIRAMTNCQIAIIPNEAVRALAFQSPATIGLAMWRDTLADGSVLREWVTNIARRDSVTRLAHLLCEIGLRIEAAGLGVRARYSLPMTQEHLADCVGLTPVHVNRMLKVLERRGHIEWARGLLIINDWPLFSAAGDFQRQYLHLAVDAVSE